MKIEVLRQLTQEQLVDMVIGSFHTHLSWGYTDPKHGVLMTYNDQYGRVNVEKRKIQALMVEELVDVYQRVYKI